jgi:hypothetical protein
MARTPLKVSVLQRGYLSNLVLISEAESIRCFGIELMLLSNYAQVRNCLLYHGFSMLRASARLMFLSIHVLFRYK